MVPKSPERPYRPGSGGITALEAPCSPLAYMPCPSSSVLPPGSHGSPGGCTPALRVIPYEPSHETQTPPQAPEGRASHSKCRGPDGVVGRDRAVGGGLLGHRGPRRLGL